MLRQNELLTLPERSEWLDSLLCFSITCKIEQSIGMFFRDLQ